MKPSIVFAHGLWADGSCFSKLIPKLLAEAYRKGDRRKVVSLSRPTLLVCDVRSWPKPDMAVRDSDVRFRGGADIRMGSRNVCSRADVCN